MATVEELTIIARMKDKLTPVVKRVEAELKSLKTKGSSAFKALGTAAKIAGAAFKSMLGPLSILTAAISGVTTVLGVSMVRAAADAEELSSKFDALFGNAADAARDWAETYRASVGRGRQDTLAALADMRGFTEGLGLAQDEADQLAFKLTSLGNDLSSFYNVEAEDAFQRLRSGLIGNTEALDAFGARISESQLKEYADEVGVLYNELTDSEKVLLRLELLQVRVNKGIGDAERTAGSFQNQMRALSGIITDQKVRFGDYVKDGVLVALDAMGGPSGFQKIVEVTLGSISALARELAEITGGGLRVFASQIEEMGGSEAVVAKLRDTFKELSLQVQIAFEEMRLAVIDFQNTGIGKIIGASIGETAREELTRLKDLVELYERIGAGNSFDMDGARARIAELEAMLAKYDSRLEALNAKLADLRMQGTGGDARAGTLAAEEARARDLAAAYADVQEAMGLMDGTGQLPSLASTASEPEGVTAATNPGGSMGSGFFAGVSVQTITATANAVSEYQKKVAAAQKEQMKLGAANQITDTLAAIASGARDAGEAFKGLAQSILQMVLRAKIAQFVFPLFGLNPLQAFADGGIVKGGGFTGGGAMPVKGYAKGGPIFREPHMAVIGEGSMNEAAVPLPDGKSIPVTLRGGERSGGSTMVQLTVNAVDASSVAELFARNGEALAQVLSEQFQRNRTFRATFSGGVI